MPDYRINDNDLLPGDRVAIGRGAGRLRAPELAGRGPADVEPADAAHPYDQRLRALPQHTGASRHQRPGKVSLC
jgi:hypothetical protein